MVTTTETEQAREPKPAEALTPEEEKVVRMLHGMSEEGSYELKFALGADEELRHRLGLLEHYLMQLFEAEEMDEELLARIDALRQDTTHG